MVDWNVGSHEMLFSARTKCDNMLIIAQGTIAYQKSASDFLETRSVPPLQRDPDGHGVCVVHSYHVLPSTY